MVMKTDSDVMESMLNLNQVLQKLQNALTSSYTKKQKLDLGRLCFKLDNLTEDIEYMLKLDNNLMEAKDLLANLKKSNVKPVEVIKRDKKLRKQNLCIEQVENMMDVSPDFYSTETIEDLLSFLKNKKECYLAVCPCTFMVEFLRDKGFVVQFIPKSNKDALVRISYKLKDRMVQYFKTKHSYLLDFVGDFKFNVLNRIRRDNFIKKYKDTIFKY